MSFCPPYAKPADGAPLCAQPVPYPCAWDRRAQQYVCAGPHGQPQYFACNSSPYGLRNYDATYTSVGPPVYKSIAGRCCK